MGYQGCQSPLDLVLSKLKVVKKRGKEYICHCPAHDDKTPSLTVTQGKGGSALVHCHANCPIDDVLAKIGMEARDLFADSVSKQYKPAAAHNYVDAAGKLVYQVRRYPNRKFVQRRPDGSGGWIHDLKGVERVVYKLPAVLKAIECAEVVYIVEGEKDADRLSALGLTATTNSEGAGKWTDSLSAYLKGGNVVVIPDNDEPGKDHAKAVQQSLEGVAESVKVLELPGLPEKGDVSDWLAAGGTKAKLIELTEVVEAIATVAVLGQDDPSARLLEAIGDFISRYVVFEKSEQTVAVSLWVAHTHVLEAAECTPYLAITSPMKRCGKTRFLEVLELLTPRPIRTANISDAALFRTIAQNRPVILLDEADMILGPKSDRQDLKGLVNAGYRRGGNVLRCEADGSKQTVREYDAFSAKALAAIGSLPDTIDDRAIRIRLQRKNRHEPIERFRSRVAREEAEPIRKALEAWGVNGVDALKDNWPQLPEELNDRAQDCWEPLLAIADAASGRWPHLARNAAVALHTDGAASETSHGSLLLEHLRDIFAGKERLATADLLNRLVEVEDGPWGEWWGVSVSRGEIKGAASQLAHILKPFGIVPKKIRQGKETARGYERVQFEDAWRRYLEPSSVSMKGKVGTHGTRQLARQIKDGTEEELVLQRIGRDQGCSDVPLLKPEQGSEQRSQWEAELEL